MSVRETDSENKTGLQREVRFGSPVLFSEYLSFSISHTHTHTHRTWLNKIKIVSQSKQMTVSYIQLDLWEAPDVIKTSCNCI